MNLQLNNNQIIKQSDPKYISQNDFIYFKNELLKDLKVIESKILSKVKATTDQFESKILTMNSKINIFQTKITELSASINSDANQTERINKLYTFKTNIEEKFYLQEKRIKELNDYLNESIYSMNKTVQENINYPGVIGTNSKFQNFHAFVDFLMNNMNNFNSFKEKINNLDILNYKTKFDKVMKSYKMQMDSFINTSQNMTKDTLVIYDNKLNNLLAAFDNKIQEEKDMFQKYTDKVTQQYNEITNNLSSIKDEFSKKLDINKDECTRKIASISLSNDRYDYDFENLNKKIDKTNDYIKNKYSDFDDKLKEQESKLLSKINHLFSLIKKSGSLLVQRKNHKDNSFNFDKEFNIFRSLDKNMRETVPVESRIKKYIEGEITIDEIVSNKERKRLQNSSNENDLNGINKMYENDIMPLMNNVKFVNFHNEAIKNNQENPDSKSFIDKKKVASYIIEKENVIINKIPRKQIIKNLLQSTSEPLSNYFVKNKRDKKESLNKIKANKKKSSTIKGRIIDINNNSFKNYFNNSTSHFFLKRKNEEGPCFDNADFEDLQDINRRTFSSAHSQTRNEQNSMRQNSIMNYNTTDLLKENNTKSKENMKTTNDNGENNVHINNNNNNNNTLNKSINNIKNKSLDKSNIINKSIDKENILNPITNINKEIFIQDDNKENDYQKKRTKIIHNFNSASKLFDLNIKSENLWNVKYKINPIQKNMKIIKNSGSPLNHTLKLKIDKDKTTQRPPIHFYLNVKNKNKK